VTDGADDGSGTEGQGLLVPPLALLTARSRLLAASWRAFSIDIALLNKNELTDVTDALLVILRSFFETWRS
jgi:hypothetical protein